MTSGKLLSKILEKWPVKVLSLTAAIIIAMFYRMNTLDTRSFSVPLKVKTNDLLISTSSFIDTIKVSLRGEPSSINPILEEDIEAFIDLSKYTSEGLQKVPIQIRKKGSALGVDPLEISVLPAQISLVLEKKVSRNIPVSPDFRGTIAYGYELTGQSIIPDSVTAEGPSSIIHSLHEFLTEAIDLEGRYADFSTLVRIINDNPLVTIYGDRMIEYHGTINSIVREWQDLEPENRE